MNAYSLQDETNNYEGQVIVGPETEDGPWYFSLNNRRLWVFKRCSDEGLLHDNLIPVRVRKPKSAAEMERYTLTNCAVEAKIVPERHANNVGHDKTASSTVSEVDITPSLASQQSVSQQSLPSTTSTAVVADVDSDDDNSETTEEEEDDTKHHQPRRNLYENLDFD
jgi:hypothetical protein